jgi:hypothetical protein
MSERVKTSIRKTTRNGQAAVTITCDCATHAEGARSAILTSAATSDALSSLTGRTQAERIHGFVTMANHPARMIQLSNARKGIYPN